MLIYYNIYMFDLIMQNIENDFVIREKKIELPRRIKQK
jgi:hypothetical protein